ncbi:hypothetical protein SEVIR_1G010600v4 [Setaria viridis]|uniref:Protein Lines C-terminal domain-containing protein n=1 Tax=Setaria viridis TaxID=4556 RepID=A0A4U6W330_SETVI|nr:uncharacterized protein LOC117849076 isoform X2 [Setaria viridis]XP_034586581.1 uncharacterized protein LOC117849076 isoform X2 [Setaria viridis]TKW36878.1 hypothetical protein SEVIR_1G010600v2 [Setaria viridis]
MAPPPEWQKRRLTRLCDLVAASLLPHLEAETLPPRQLTREDERRLLLVLSKVNKAILGWSQEEEEEEQRRCESDQEIFSCSGEVHSCSLPPGQHPHDGFGCLANVVSILVGVLGFCSGYVKHSAGNVLVSISSTLIKFDSIWIQFIELVWAAIHAESKCVHNALHSTTDSNNEDITSSSTSITSFMTVLNERCLDISEQTMSSLFRVLHAILKFLKHSDSELKDDFICLSIHHIQNMPSVTFHPLHTGEIVNRVKDSRFGFCNDSLHSGILTGSLLQLLCSLLEQSYLEGTDGQDMYVKLVDIVPKIAASLQEQHDGSKSLYQYLKHKILMVMMRLKPYMQQDCSRIVCYLKLLRQYFHDLLHEPISQHIAKLDNCLEGSPFLLNMVDLVESQDKSTRHLQRQAIYLFLSFSICLSYNRNDGTLQCSCKRDDCLLGHKVQGCSDHCSCSGLSEISDWFQRCYLDMSFDSKSSTDIALSFLALYMEEDDMLFSILLQLFDAPHIFLKIDSMNSTELIGAKLFSSIFDPVHLFHLLLLLLHYDHMVLVDYLISKDVGVHCAQYLLRCLRLVSQSWHAFVDDSMYLTKIEKIDCKRQRTSRDISSARASSSKEYKNGSGCDKEAKNSQKLFLDAKVCLYSLKRTVEDLQKKGLFPYNPKPLLRSLARFEELCEQG